MAPRGKKAGAKATEPQAAGSQVAGAQTAGVQPSAGSEDPPMSAAEVRKANQAADKEEAAAGEHMYRLDRGEALPSAPFRTATDREEGK